MSKRPLTIDTLLLSDDEDDDLLLKEPKTFSRKKPGVVTPKDEECLTPLGTCTLPLIAGDEKCIGEEVTLTLQDKGTTPIITLRDKQGQFLSSLLPQTSINKLAPILRNVNKKFVTRATRTSPQFLQIDVSAKANRILGEFECAPLRRDVYKHLGDDFVRARKVTPVKSETLQAAAPLVARSSNVVVAAAATTNGLPVITPTNTSTHAEGRVYATEQETIVETILANEQTSYYAILQVPNQATMAELNASYRRLARLVHPDKNKAPNATRAFQLVGQAYSILSNPHQRAEYDTELAQTNDQKPASVPTDSTPFEFDAEELYRSFFPEDDVDEVEVVFTETDWQNQKDSLEQMFDTQVAEQLKDVPAYDMPPQLAHMNLFDYQIDGIRWLIHQERRNGIPTWFEQEGVRTWRDKITGSTFQRRPPPVKGGILADDMGLGKSIQTIGLILSNPPKGQKGYPYVPARSLGKKEPRATLILCPLSVIANWTSQIKKHVNKMGRKDFLKVCIYHGPNRKNMVRSIQANYYDIVLTSYQTLAFDYRRYIGADIDPQKGKARVVKKAKHNENELFLFDLWLHRVVLDESHIIRNSKTTLFKAVKMLSSTYKLCLTGTVFVNHPDDIHSLLSFLGALPLAQKHVFKRFVTDKIKERKEVGMSVLRTALAYVTLRRRKDMVASSVKLVSRTINIEAIAFEDGPHKSLHDILYTSARSVLCQMFMLGEDVVLNNYMTFLIAILRVRQAACHAALIPPECKERAEEVLKLIKEKGRAAMNAAEAEDLLDTLQGILEGDEKLEECAVCMDVINEESAVILRECKHVFCSPCLEKVPNSCCPLCRKSFLPDDMVTKAQASAAASVPTKKKAPKLKGIACTQSPKLKKMFAIIEQMKPDEKGVIFSQWTSLLDIVQREMQKLGHTFTRIDGRMNAQARIDAMEAFDTRRCDSMRTPKFILCSLMACGTGINLDRGSVAFLLDPWYNVALENQCMNRIHRISSKRPVRIYRLVMDETLEQRMLGLQDAKNLVGKGAMQRLSAEEKRKARLTQLRDLFQLPEHLEQDWAEF